MCSSGWAVPLARITPDVGYVGSTPMSQQQRLARQLTTGSESAHGIAAANAGIEFAVTFSHCRDVVAAVARAGGFGVPARRARALDGSSRKPKWMNDHVDGKPYGSTADPGNAKFPPRGKRTSPGEAWRRGSRRAPRLHPQPARDHVIELTRHDCSPTTSHRRSTRSAGSVSFRQPDQADRECTSVCRRSR